MFRNGSVLLVAILLTTMSHAEESSRVSLPLEEHTTLSSAPNPYSIVFDMEFRDQRDLRSASLRPTNRSYQDVHEISLGGSYSFSDELSAFVEISLEQINQQSTFFAKEAYVDWHVWPDRLNFVVGQQFLPVGLLNQRDNLFSSNPPFMQTLFANSKGIDLGVVAQVYPIASKWIYLEGSQFAGRFVRSADQRDQAPETPPTIFSLKSHSEFHDAFFTSFNHHLAFFDAIHAWGAGFEARSPIWHGVQVNLLSEYWRFEQVQTTGPNEWNRALLIYSNVKWWRLTAGYRWSENHSQMESVLGTEALPLETSRLALLEVELAKPLSLRAERVIENQSETTRDEWVARALVHWQM